MRAGRVAAATALAAAALAALAPANARAYHDEKNHVVENTAFTLRDDAIRLGLWKGQYGLWGSLMFGTYWAPWLLKVANLHLKWMYWREGPVALAAQAGIYHLDTKSFEKLDEDAGSAVLNVIPLELFGSYRFDEPYWAHASVVYTLVSLEGQLGDEALGGAGKSALDNLQLTATFEWRVTRVTALLLQARYLVFQRAGLSAEATAMADDYTTVKVHGGATTDALDFPHLFSIVPAAAWSWNTFNLRVGLGYGNFNVPGVNFMIPVRFVVPELDLYWVF